MTNLSATNVVTLPPPEMPLRRVVRAYLYEAVYELLHLLRSPAMGFPSCLPALLYFFFGVVLAGASPDVRSEPTWPTYIFSGWCGFAAMGPAIFGVGAAWRPSATQDC